MLWWGVGCSAGLVLCVGWGSVGVVGFRGVG